ncbi:unnamed protein product [Phytophthora fragariaefolia]|uniref:Unnamed protein product n=1 Tax=Phytophthora fragariaefolia TaxID=1490495 RepID=A0A9W7D297_9STRA|nr:unnamed protein product [Phytophthora fragariaefolia]
MANTRSGRNDASSGHRPSTRSGSQPHSRVESASSVSASSPSRDQTQPRAKTARARVKDGAKDVIVPVKTTFDQGFLRLWCRLRWHIAIDDVTDDHIRSEVDLIIASMKNNNVPDIDNEMRSKLRMDLTETDVSERVIQYFKTCHEIIDDNGWRVFSRMTLAGSNFVAFLLHHWSHKRFGRKLSGRSVSKHRPKLPPKPCPHCDEMHWLSECPTATEEEKSEIRRMLRTQRNNGNKKEGARLKRLREGIPSDEKTVALNDIMELPYCADTGADRTAISRAHVDELMLRDPTVTMIRLATPVVNTTVAKHEITCINAVYLRLLLNTAAGPVALYKPVECLVIDGDEPEFILGQDVLKQLGITIDRQLEQLARHVDDEDDDLEDFSMGVPGFEPATTDKELREAVEKMVQMVLQNGFFVV